MPLLQFSSYIKQICVHSACAQVWCTGAANPACQGVDFFAFHCQRFLGSVAQQVKMAQREPGGLFSQLLSGAKWRPVVSRHSFCRDLLMQAGSTHIHPTLDLHISEIYLEGRGSKKCGVMEGSICSSSSCTKINDKRSVEVDLQSLLQPGTWS